MLAQRMLARVGIGLVALGISPGFASGAAFAAAAPATPGGVSVVRAPSDANQLKVTWKTTKNAHHYEVELFDSGHRHHQRGAVHHDHAEPGCLRPCTTYKVKVGARDTTEAGGTTNWLTVKPLAPGAVGKLTATRGNDRSTVQATWNAPAWPGYTPITGYRTQLVRQPDNTTVADTVVTDTSATIAGADRASKYLLIVSAQNQFGSCLVAKATINADKPGTPTDLTAARDAANPALVNVAWQAPADPTAQPTYYKLTYASPGKLTKTLVVNAPLTSAQLPLDPARPWTLRVQSFNDIGGSTTLSNIVALAPVATTVPTGPDTTPPSITSTIAPPANPSGWHKSAATVTFNCLDAQSGVSACSAPVALAGDGRGQAVTGTATDKAGKVSSRTATINIDTVPPTISATLSPVPNGNGWHNGPVTVTFTCSDDLSGVDTCPAPVKVPGDTAYKVDVTGTAKDKAGNTATTNLTVNTDRIAPTISAQSVAPNANGWHHSDVAVTFTCANPVSGVASCTSPVTVSDEGAAQVVSGDAADKAGNTASANKAVNLDKTAPTISAEGPQANGNGWHNGPVTVSFACADPLSGIEACGAPVTLTADGADQVATGTATDKAGNAATISRTASIDGTAPFITATLVSAANSEGWYNSALAIHYTCADELSGIESCPADAEVTDDGAGQVITRTATDKAGNTASATTVVNVDRSKPLITTVRTAANDNGWNKGR